MGRLTEGIHRAVSTGERLECALDNGPIDGDDEPATVARRVHVTELHGEVVLTLTPTHR